MSESDGQHDISGGAPGGQDRPPGQEPPKGKKPGSSRGTWIGIAGGLVIAGIAAGVLLPSIVRDKPPVVGEESTLEVLVPADINPRVTVRAAARVPAEPPETASCATAAGRLETMRNKGFHRKEADVGRGWPVRPRTSRRGAPIEVG